jgi:hypothetical protein
MTSIFGNNCSSTSGDSGGGGEPEEDPNAWKLQGNSFTSTERKLGTIDDQDVNIITEDSERIVIEDGGDIVIANNSVLHSRRIDMTKVERFTNNFNTGITFSNDRTQADITIAETAVYTTALIAYTNLSILSAEIKILDSILNSTTIKLGACTADRISTQAPNDINRTQLTITGLQRNDILKIEIDQTDDLNRTLNIYKNGVLDQTTPISISNSGYRALRIYALSDVAVSSFGLVTVIGDTEINTESSIKTTEDFSFVDYQDNKFLEHKSDELILGSGSTTDVIRLVKPIEGSEGQEFEPLEEVVTAMGANIDYTFDEDSDQQTITVNTSLTSSSIPNLLPFRPTTSYNRSASVNYIVENLEVISSGSIGIGLYTTPPLNYETATGDPSSLYGTKYVSFNSSGVLLPASLDSVFTVIYRAARPEWKSIATHDLQLSLSSEEYKDKEGLMINFTVNDVLAFTVFAEVLDSLNPNNTNYEIYYLQPTRGTIKFDTDLATDGGNVQIQGYEVKKEFDRLLPYDNTSFNITDSAGVGVLTEEEYVIDFDNGSNNDFTITEVSETEVTVVKATNTSFSISYSQNPIDVAKYDWVVECILNSATGSSFRFQLSEIQYIPTTNAEPFTDGEWGTGYATNFRPNTGTLYTTTKRLNNVNTTSEIIGSGATLDKVRYTIVNGLLTAEYQLSTDSSYQPSPVLNIDLLEGVNNLYYISANDSQTTNGGFNVNFIFTRTEKTIDTPSIQLNDNILNVINFQGDLEIKSNNVQYMDMADSSIMLNQPMMLHSGDYAYMYILPTNAGTMFWNSEANKLFVCDGDIWNVPGETMTVLISNENFGGVDTQLTQQGYVLIPSATRDFEVRFADSVAAINVMGIIAHLPIGGILLTSTPSPIPLAMSGYWDVAVEADTYTRDDYLASTAAGIAYEKTGTSNTFAISSSNAVVVTNGDKIRAWLHCVD